jgi:hypothetical protein
VEKLYAKEARNRFCINSILKEKQHLHFVYNWDLTKLAAAIAKQKLGKLNSEFSS